MPGCGFACTLGVRPFLRWGLSFRLLWLKRSISNFRVFGRDSLSGLNRDEFVVLDACLVVLLFSTNLGALFKCCAASYAASIDEDLGTGLLLLPSILVPIGSVTN